MLLAGAAVAALGAASPALAQDTAPPPPPADEPAPPPTDPAPPEPIYDAYVPIDDTEAPATPLSGTINPFYGDINPFTGTINPFYGDINPFWGDINPFNGDIVAFWGDINPFYGDINPFHGDIVPFWGDINPFNADAPALPVMGEYWQYFGNAWKGTESLWTNPLLGAALTLKMNEVIIQTRLTWGASIQAQTGHSFETAFLNPLLARYGINPTSATSLRALSAEKRAQFFVDWYDSLMAFAGIDRPDHWMRTVNWTPSITQQQGSGADTIIGLLDATPMNDPDIADNVAWFGGGGATVNGHGVGVASLMVAAHDRQGVMGIAPNATVIAYNPFDQSGTANWRAVRTGVLSLAERGASIINMSLGVSGHTLSPDWRKIFFDPAVYMATRDSIFVLAAGNDGRVQYINVPWSFHLDPNLIIVGSVNSSGQISSFSNTPGNACLLSGGQCREPLMNRFMVAPGELILLPDGLGGFVRRSGTSFAAPLVSGAIALLHDRWPWLANHPRESVDIIFQSARDLGAPGVDPIYGHGLLDVAASQSPLNYNNLVFYEVRNGVMTQRSITDLRSGGAQTSWEADGVYFHLYEPIGSTFRDFTVPVSSQLVGQVRSLTGALEYFQRFAQRGLTDFINGTGFTDMATVDMPALNGLQLSVAGGSPYAYLTGRDGPTPHTLIRFRDVSSGLAFTAGHGNGAMAMNGVAGLAMSSDHSRDGGVNPLLALASGGEFASVDMPLGRNTLVSFGVTRQQRDDDEANPFQSDLERLALQGVDRFEAEAMNVRISHQASPSLLISGAYARIRENNALLGVQSPERTDFTHGATSETATLSASLNIGSGFTFAASGTLGRTRAAGEQGFVTQGEGVLSTAFAASLTREGLLGRHDALRLSVAQPLHIERGQLAYRSVQVIDRTTGELGVADQPFEASGDPRSLIGELLYQTPILSGNGEIGLFGRTEFRPEGNLDINQFAVGSRVSIRF